MTTAMDEVVLPYEPVSNERKRRLENVMRQANKVLYGRYKQAVANGGPNSRMKFRGELFAKMDSGHKTVSLYKVRFTESDLATLRMLRDCEWELLCCYSRVITKMTLYWSKRFDDVAVDSGDLYSEGIVALLNAIYCYGGKPAKKGKTSKVKFITYAYWCIYRRIMTYCQRLEPFAVQGAENDLLRRFNQVKYESNGPMNLDETVEIMGLNDKQFKSLVSMLVTVLNQASVQQDIGNDEHVDADYSLMATTWHGPCGTEMKVSGRHNGSNLVKQSEEILEPDMLDAVKQTPMSDWERAVFEAYLNGGRGWQTEVALQHTNPETNKPYSKRAPHIALERVKTRILDTYENLKAA